MIYWREQNGLFKVNWGSSGEGLVYTRTMKKALELNDTQQHVKNFRPGLLVLSGTYGERPHLTNLANNITKNTSVMVPISILNEKKRAKSGLLLADDEDYYRKSGIAAFVKHLYWENFGDGARAALQAAGLGSLKPNTLLMGYKNNWMEKTDEVRGYIGAVTEAFMLKYGVAILRKSWKDESELALDKNGNKIVKKK